ncbi:putative aspartokinase [groundwater metagenome]|uniref:aspartate kinase n=1 Tax=groundwater metagenome TaxID=717931 RepID=A0A098E919_9ZZZZ
MDKKIIVLKFGGFAVSTGENIKRICAIVKKEREKYNVVVTVSALYGVTDKLVEISEKISNLPAIAVEDAAKNFYDEILSLHCKTAKECIADEKILKEVIEKITALLEKLRITLIGVGYLEEINPKFMDYVLSFGEKMSVYVIRGALNDANIKAVPLTGYEAGIITDSNFSHAKPLPIIGETIRKNLMPLIEENNVPVVAGFISADIKGTATTLGRGGSDYTAVLLAKHLNAVEVQIIKDVEGVLSADPKIVPNAKLLKELSYAEAMDLALFGAKVMYSKMIEPAMDAKIPVRVKSIFKPDDEGTVIVKNEEIIDRIVKAVTMMKDIAVINIKGVGMAETPGIIGKIFSELGNKGINIVMVSGSSESNLSVVVKKSDVERTLEIINQLSNSGMRKVEVMENVRIIAVIGAGMAGSKGVAAKIFKIVADNDASIIMIAQGSSEVNISFVVEEKFSEDIVKAIHREFAEK